MGHPQNLHPLKICTYSYSMLLSKDLHWNYNNAVHLLNKAKSQLFQSIMNFEIQKSPVFCLPASLPAIRPGCARCRALKIIQNNSLLCWIYETDALKTIFLLHHGDSFSFLTLFFSLLIGMRKQFV